MFVRLTHLMVGVLAAIILSSNLLAGASGKDEGDIVLVGGKRRNEGTVLIKLNNRWGTICSDNWGRNEAITACRQLGFTKSNPLVAVNAFYGKTLSKSHQISMTCRSPRRRLEKCRVHGARKCGPENAAGVQCQPQLDVRDSDIEARLVEKTAVNVGGVELRVRGQWGAVCGEPHGFNWPHDIAPWACKKLGFSGRQFPMSMAVVDVFPRRDRKVWHDRVYCYRQIKPISECIERPWGNVDCNSDKMAGVICDPDIYQPNEGETALRYRLVDAPNDRAGRLEVLQFGIWSSIPSILPFAAAEVICKERGFPWGGLYGRFDDSRIKYPDDDKFTGSAWTAGILCEGNMTSFGQCIQGNWTRTVIKDGNRAWIECFTEPHASVPALTMNKAALKSGDRVNVTCSSSNGNQIPHLSFYCPSWHCYGCRSFQSATVGNMTYRHMSFKAKSSYNGKSCTCGAMSGSHWTQRTQITLNITYGPERLRLTLSHPVRENHEVTATCESFESNPTPQLFWYLDGRLLNATSRLNITRDANKGFDVGQNYTFVAKRWQSGRRIKCSAYNGISGHLEQRSAKLDVHRGPKVRAQISPRKVGRGEKAHFSCHIDANPIITRGVWKRDTFHLTSPLKDFTLPDITFDDEGTYTCTVKDIYGTVAVGSAHLQFALKLDNDVSTGQNYIFIEKRRLCEMRIK